MKVLKALLAIFTFLAAALTCTLLFVQDRNAPHYIKNLRERAVSSFSDRQDPRKAAAPPSGGSLFFMVFSSVSGNAQFTLNRQTS